MLGLYTYYTGDYYNTNILGIISMILPFMLGIEILQ